ncbi:MAG: protein-methionine-sulfoxide reductase catalytic subunit MsrP [Bdellovibrio sp.]|nr:protein-methionine-sulfoxide reductase catalytic subunit MsrP [Bdellovibrio sp.]
MNSKTKKPWQIDGATLEDITPEYYFINRRRFMKNSFRAAAAAALPFKAWGKGLSYPAKVNDKYKLSGDSAVLTKEDIATSYNNFYEFSLDKDGVKSKVGAWTLDKNWQVEIAGLVENKKSFAVDDLINFSGASLEERIYRFRCVEGWSMVVPWTGIPLSDLITKLKPKSSAKYVKFQTFGDKKIGPNIGGLSQYPWPYTEALTMEEAMNPLTIIATGMYGKALPKQNGAPLRLVVPWKYGFKSIKSIVKIEFTEEKPKTLWSSLAPDEYGFYANVNPKVDHPRWSQANEKILDGSFLPKRKPTLLFNGYEKEVAHLYAGLDLKKNY